MLTSDISLNIEEVKKYLKKEMFREVADIDYSRITIQQISKPIKTIAGKNRAVVN